MLSSNYRGRFAYAAMVCICLISNASAAPAFDTSESGQYLIIARNRINGNTDVATNNFELGANKAPVPCTDSFLDGGSSGGPTLQGAVPALPTNAAAVFQGVGYGGNIAITDSAGEFELQDVGVYGDSSIGIRVAGPNSTAINKSSNAFFNDPNMFPNTFNIATQTGNSVNPSAAVQSTRIESPTNAGVTYNYNHSSLLAELSAARTAINSLAATGTLDVSGNSGKIDTDYTFTATAGLNVIDIITGGNDFLVQNANFVIDGPEESAVIFRLPDTDNMLISNANVLAGNGGMGLRSILFYTDQNENDTHFSFSNTILNGVAFWSLSDAGGSIDISNAQGCTQLVADVVDMDDVRLNRCSYIPEPTMICLLGVGGLTLISRKRRT